MQAEQEKKQRIHTYHLLSGSVRGQAHLRKAALARPRDEEHHHNGDTQTFLCQQAAGRTEQSREQATQSTRWMPGRLRPTKDAETGETFKGSCIQAMSLEIPNGATPPE